MLVNLKEILEIAEKEKKAIGMFNATGFDSLQAVIVAAEELNQPVIIAHAEVHNVYNDISMVGPAMVAVAQNAKVPVCVHLDHGISLDMIYKALRLGFTSVMIDASALPYEENLAVTKKVVEMAHAMNVSVEAELGRLVTGEAGSGETHTEMKAEDYYTDADEAKAFVEETGVDALAIAFGTAHGFYTAQPKLDFSVIERVAKATGVPLVMHGGSGLADDVIRKVVSSGINKININSDLQAAWYKEVCTFIKENPSIYDPRKVISSGKNAIYNVIETKFNIIK